MKLNLEKNQWLPIIAGLAWLCYVFGTYLYHHPPVTASLMYLHYPWVLSSSVGLALLGYWIMSGFTLKLSWKKDLHFRPFLAWLSFFLVLALLHYKLLEKTVPEGMPLEQLTRNFMTLSLKYFALLGTITLSAGAWGHWFLRLIVGQAKHLGFWPSTAFGFSILCTLTFFQALIAPINSVFLWFLILAPLPFSVPYLIKVLHIFFWKPKTLKKVPVWAAPLTALIGLFIALSWISSIKLFPTGYDGLSYYGNLANLLGQNGELIGGYQPYQWSLLMSWGWHLLNDPALGFLIGFLPGWLAIGALYLISRRYLNIGGSLVVLLLWLSLPASTFHYGQTEKVDLALHFVLLSGILFYFQSDKWHKGKDKPEKTRSFMGLEFGRVAQSWLLLGWLMGFALGIKLTAFFLLFAWSCLILYKQGNYLLLRWGFLVLLGAFFGFGLERAAGADYGSYVVRSSGLILMATGIYELHKRYGLWSVKLKTVYSQLLALMIGAALCFSPWPLKNAADSGALEVQRVLKGPTEQPPIELEKVDKPTFDLSAEGKLAGLVFLGTSRREELGKFLGFDEGFFKYFSVLFKITTNPGMERRTFVNIGFYLLFSLPLLLFFSAGSFRWHLWIKILFLIFFLGISNYLVWQQPELGTFESTNRLITNQPDGFGTFLAVFPEKVNGLFYALGTYLDQLPLLGSRSWRILNVFLSIALLLLIRQLAGGLLKSLRKKDKDLIVLTTAYLFMWYITGSGIPWYGFTGLALLFILVQLFFKSAPQGLQRVHILALSTSFIVLFLYRFSGAGMSKKPASDPELVLNSPLLYSAGAYKNVNDILKNTNDIYYRAKQLINKKPNTKIYMAGTLFTYFIDDNHRRVHQDNQFEEFSAIRRAKEEDPNHFLQVLIENGFDYIIFNPSDINYDRTPEQSFRKKFDNFNRILSQSDLVDLVLTDNKIRNQRGEVVTGINGSPVKYGQLAVLKLRTK